MFVFIHFITLQDFHEPCKASMAPALCWHGLLNGIRMSLRKIASAHDKKLLLPEDLFVHITVLELGVAP
jgi:hypothetical protein